MMANSNPKKQYCTIIWILFASALWTSLRSTFPQTIRTLQLYTQQECVRRLHHVLPTITTNATSDQWTSNSTKGHISSFQHALLGFIVMATGNTFAGWQWYRFQLMSKLLKILLLMILLNFKAMKHAKRHTSGRGHTFMLKLLKQCSAFMALAENLRQSSDSISSSARSCASSSAPKRKVSHNGT